MDADLGCLALPTGVDPAYSGYWPHRHGFGTSLRQERRCAATDVVIPYGMIQRASVSIRTSGPISLSVAHPHKAIATSSSVRKICSTWATPDAPAAANA